MKLAPFIVKHEYGKIKCRDTRKFPSAFNSCSLLVERTLYPFDAPEIIRQIGAWCYFVAQNNSAFSLTLQLRLFLAWLEGTFAFREFWLESHYVNPNNVRKSSAVPLELCVLDKAGD